MSVQFPAVIELSSLNGKNGFVIDGIAASESGRSVASAGDVNGDGVVDLIVGAYKASPNGHQSGQSYVIFGSSGIGSSGIIQLSNLSGSNGFNLNGITASDYSGRSVASAGDVNADGVADLIVGANGASPNGQYSGQSYIIFGSSGIGSSRTIQLSNLNGSNGFTLNGISADDYSGISVASAGDVNDDGMTDLIVGANGASPNGQSSGQSYVIFGDPEIGSSGIIELLSLNGSNGFTLNGIAASESGHSVASAGDVNADGVADLIVGAYKASPNGHQSGQSYVIFGSSGIGSSGIIQLSNLSGSNGFNLSGITASDYSGRSVASAGDVNADGVADLIVGANGASPNGQSSGQSYVIFGSPEIGSSGIMELSSLNGSNGFKLNGISADDYSGISVASAGDVNADGVADLIVGANGASPNGHQSGQSYIIFGSSGIGSSGIIQLSSLNGSNGFTLNGIETGDNSGRSVASAGDVNGDGVTDLIVGAYLASPNGADSGQNYVIFGDTTEGINFANNQLTINQGQSIVLTTNNLNTTSTRQDANSLQFQITTIQYGQFAFVSNPNFSITEFYQQNITDGNVQFTQDGSVNVPYYEVSIFTGRWATSAPFPGNVIFGLALINNGFEINQGGYEILSRESLLATNGLGIPDSQIQFSMSNIEYGVFTKTDIPDLSITSFTQADINANQIQFVTNGTPNVPSYDITISDGSYTLLTVKNGNITFHYAPELIVNALSITQGQTILLNNNGINFKATDAVTPLPELVFSISALAYGRFELVARPGVMLTNFTQGQVDNIEIQFVQDGSPNIPSYNVSVINTFGAMSKPSSAIVDWTPKTGTNLPRENNNTTRNVLISISASAAVLAAAILCYISFGYLKNYRLNAIAKNKDGDDAEYYQETIIPLAKEVFNRIKITSLMNYISANQMHEYVAAIAKVVHEISEHGINIQLQDMPAEQKILLVNQIIADMKEILGLNNETSRCNASYFFKPQTTPAQLRDNAKAIADAVHTALFSGNTHTAINLPRGVEVWQMGGKTNERTPLLSA